MFATLDQNHWHKHVYVSCTSEFTSDINHIFFSDTIAAISTLGLWLQHQSDTWCQKGIWNGYCFLTLITPVLQEHIKHEHIPHFCSTTWTKSYIIGQELLRRSLGLICSRLHLRVTSQLPGLLHLPVKLRLSASCTMTDVVWAVSSVNDPLHRLAYLE